MRIDLSVDFMKSIVWLMVAAVPALGLAGEYDVENALLRREAARLPDGLSVSFAAADAKGNAEGYRIDGDARRVTVSGATRRARIYGLGRLLRENGFRGESAPEMPVRGIYFATHFGNWYDRVPEDELVRYVEDLALWGCNQVRVWLDMHEVTGPDDPLTAVKVAQLKMILRAAERCGLGTSLLALGNEAFAGTPKELLADWRGGQNGYRHAPCGHYHVEICPSKPGGLDLILRQREQVFDLFSDVKITDVQIFPYDQGGCTCADCAPWGVNGLFKILPRFSELAKRKFPGCTVNFATWRFDVFGDLGEWDGLFRRGEELRKYVDELTIERTDKIANGTPGGLPAASMAEISMGGMLPWGGYGANPRPKFVAKSIASAKGRLAGFRPYSEGIYEDLNKVLFLILGWDTSKTWQQAVAEYSDFHFGKGVAEDVVRATGILEDNLRHEASLVQGDKRYGVYNAVEVDRTKPYRYEFGTRNPRPDSRTALQALDLLSAAQDRLSPSTRASWRWRILWLRALIDRRLADGASLDDPEVAAALRELVSVYRSDATTEVYLAPPVAVAPTPYTHQNFLDDPEEFRFAVIPDRTGGDGRGAWTNALEKANLLRPTFVMTVGDLIPAGWLDEKSVTAQHEELRGQLAKVVPPFYSVVGNHDIQNPLSKRLWQRHFGKDTYYSFVYRNVLFMALNSQDAGNSVMSEKQYAWIRETLAAHPDVRWTFFFMHGPDVWLTPEWKALEKGALAGRRYTVFGGDWHCYYHARRNGNDYYALSVAGGCSAMNSQRPYNRDDLKGPAYGEMDHIVWVTVPKAGKPVIANILIDGVLPADYLDQSNTKSTYFTKPIDDPADPAVVARLAALDAEKKALFYRWDGKTFDRWTPHGGWTIADGEMRFDAANGAALLTGQTAYGDVDIHFQYRLAKGAKAEVVFVEPDGTEKPVAYVIADDLCRPDAWTFGRFAITGNRVWFEVNGLCSGELVRKSARPNGHFEFRGLSGTGAFRSIYAFDLR